MCWKANAFIAERGGYCQLIWKVCNGHMQTCTDIVKDKRARMGCDSGWQKRKLQQIKPKSVEISFYRVWQVQRFVWVAKCNKYISKINQNYFFNFIECLKLRKILNLANNMWHDNLRLMQDVNTDKPVKHCWSSVEDVWNKIIKRKQLQTLTCKFIAELKTKSIQSEVGQTFLSDKKIHSIKSKTWTQQNYTYHKNFV